MKTLRRLALGLSFLLVFACMPKEIPPPLPPPKPAKVAVVLGAGVSRGFAHVGVLKILESQKIPIHLIVGTSAGSFVGSLYAYGYDVFQLQTMAMALLKDDVVDWTIPDNGFIRGEKLENFINKTVRQTPLERLKIPFRAVATNVQTGEETVFATGNTGRAVRASCSIPGVFQPVRLREGQRQRLIPCDEFPDIPAQLPEGVSGLFPGVAEPPADGPALLCGLPSGLRRPFLDRFAGFFGLVPDHLSGLLPLFLERLADLLDPFLDPLAGFLCPLFDPLTDLLRPFLEAVVGKARDGQQENHHHDNDRSHKDLLV